MFVLEKLLHHRQHANRSGQFMHSFSRFQGLTNQLVTPIFDYTHTEMGEITFSFPQFVPACTKLVHSANSFLRYRQFYSPVTRLYTPISNHPHPKTFDQLLIYMNLYQHAKKQAISLVCSGDMIDQKILQSDLLKTFWPISEEPKFS